MATSDIYTAKDPVALRAAVVALCGEVFKDWCMTSWAAFGESAERIVPKVPVTLREYKGVTYRHGGFVDADGTWHMLAARCIAWSQEHGSQTILTDDDHAALMDLRAHPTVTPTTRERTITATQTAGVTTLYVDKEPTIDEAIALLVRAGWKELKGSDGLSEAFNQLWKCRRVLIAPTPTTGAAHE